MRPGHGAQSQMMRSSKGVQADQCSISIAEHHRIPAPKALEYFRQVEKSGEPLVVTDRGLAMVEIRRYRADQRSPLEKLKGSVVHFHAPTDPVAEDEWEAQL